jgi:hypothetical protein
VQAQLFLQLILYRYILFPIALLLLIAQIQLPSLLSLLLLPLLAAFTYFINFIIHSYSECGIGRVFEQACSWLVITDCLFVLVKLPSSFIYIEAIAAAMMLLHLLARHKLARFTLLSGRQKMEYFSMLLKDLLMMLYLSREALITGGSAFFMIALISPLLLLALYREVTRTRRIIFNGLVFSAEAPVEDFIETVGVMGA